MINNIYLFFIIYSEKINNSFLFWLNIQFLNALNYRSMRYICAIHHIPSGSIPCSDDK